MESHCCNLKFPNISISEDSAKTAKFPSGIFCLWNMFVQFKFPFVGREKTCFNFYVYTMLISQQRALFCVHSLIVCRDSCVTAVMLYVHAVYDWVLVCPHKTCRYRRCAHSVLCKTPLL